MSSHKICSKIYCGEKGVGKTTYVKYIWQEHVFLDCNNPLNKLKTTSVIERALNLCNNEESLDTSRIIQHLSYEILNGKAVIFDCAESISQDILELIINSLITFKSSNLIFTFDIDKSELYQNKIFRLLIEWNLVQNTFQDNFRSSTINLNKFIVLEIENISCDISNQLIEISNYNFNNLKKLIWLIKNKQTSFEEVSKQVLEEYSRAMIEEMFSDIPTDLFDVLKKSSIIGETFEKYILESKDCFNITGVNHCLKELEKMNLFIKSYINNETYQFISNQIHTGVLECIDSKQRKDWEKILLKYYMEKLKLDYNNEMLLENLNHIKHISKSLGDYEITYFANKRLFHHYLSISDNKKALEVITEIINYCNQHNKYSNLNKYLSLYKIKIQIQIGDFSDVIESINSIKPSFPNSLYIDYYNALSLYNNGDIDESYLETKNLVSRLKSTSAKTERNQPIYALVYSLMSTLQNHFGIDDFGHKYYMLALNHASKKLDNQDIFYTILKKCDMFYPYELTKKFHNQSIDFFVNNKYVYEAAEVYLNLATEIMFNDSELLHGAFNYLQKALEIFEYTPNWKLSYVKNNIALFYIISEGNFEKATIFLEEALLVGMSDFTYFTIYLNLCMCYLILFGNNSHQFEEAYASFCKYHKLISARDNSTQYDNIYKKITDLIIMEHKKDTINLNNLLEGMISQDIESFFIPIIKDIKIRTQNHPIENNVRSSNIQFYHILNKYKIFLAEFRFWE